LQTGGAWIAMHPLEAASLPARAWHGRPAGIDRDWLHRHGVPDADIDALAIRPDRLGDLMSMAEPDRLLADGDRVPLLGREVRAVWTPGHTPGHLCLHDPVAGALLTGDHLLPRISPNVGVHAASDGDPLGAYLDSLDGMARFAGEEALPAHEYRFDALDRRAADLVAHHAERGDEVLRAVDTLPAPTAWTIAAALTWSRGWDALAGMLRRMALAETLAHLTHLTTTGLVVPVPGTPQQWRRPTP
jgi:glyoxylase-like metal-dependent hydrolase (beta-lactamase superfamily II)